MLDLHDGDRLRPGNVIRQAAPLLYAGRSKALASELTIGLSVPDAKVTSAATTWDPAQIDGAIRAADLVIDATATDAFTLLLAERDFPHESGGVLIGHLADEAVVVTALSTSGPRARSGLGSFQRDGDHAQATLDRVVASSRGRDDYLGEWHSHPANVGASPSDRRSMLEVSHDSSYRRSRPVLVVVRRDELQWVPEAHQVTRGRLARLTVDVREP